jgi:Predicted integral membrane protein (DUF2189)
LVPSWELDRCRELGLGTSWQHAFDVVRSHSIASILSLGLLLLVIFACWIFAAQSLYAVLFGGPPPESLVALITIKGGGCEPIHYGDMETDCRGDPRDRFLACVRRPRSRSPYPRTFELASLPQGRGSRRPLVANMRRRSGGCLVTATKMWLVYHEFSQANGWFDSSASATQSSQEAWNIKD